MQTNAVVYVDLDRRVFPQSVSGGIWLRSGESVPAISVDYDPVDAKLRIAPLFDLLTHAAYTIHVDGLVDLDGAPQPEPFDSVFATGGEAGEEASLAVPAWGAVEALLRDRCADSGCHAGESPALGLDLSSSEAVEDTAIGVPSRQAIAGTSGSQVPRRALTLFGLPIIDRVAERGRVATSYLLYKVLGDPHVVGERMPPDGEPLSAAQIALLRDWIRAGADTELSLP